MNNLAKDSTYTEIRLPRDKGNDILFTGRRVAQVSSDPAGLGERWTELELYETQGGRFVARSIGRSNRPGEGDLSNCRVYEKLPDVIDFFKVKKQVTWLSVELFEQIKQAYPDFEYADRVD